MIIPNSLRKGDCIGIISTARKISLDDLNYTIKILEDWGLNIVLGDNLFEEYHQFAGTIDKRRCDLQSMIDNKEIKAILCARGGYGTVQIIDNIDFSSLKKNPKWIIGYSDITVLHSHLNNLGFASIHGTMPINFSSNTKESLMSLYNSLFNFTNKIIYNTDTINMPANIESSIVGGNLSILYSLMGSNSDINTDGKILFLEDVDEYLYHIDRMTINLLRNNKFKKIKGLIIGAMSNMNDNKIPFGNTAKGIILENLRQFNFPIIENFPAGHQKDNRTIILGVNSYVEIRENHVILSQSY
tara:strand:- start:8840 stop:9739 length:900 start_codon:yes stop_codon:yes gene_type:complete